MSQIIGTLQIADPVVLGVSLIGPNLTISAPVGTNLGVTLPSATLVTTGQGPAGPQGVAGPAFSGFGYISYAEPVSDAGDTLDAGVRTQLALEADPTRTLDLLTGPFDNFVFWDGSNVLHARHSDDVFLVRVAMTATATVAGGHLDLELDIIGGSSPLLFKPAPLPDQAGVVQRVDYELIVFSRSSFVANGAQFWLTSSVPVQVKNETLLIAPISAGQ